MAPQASARGAAAAALRHTQVGAHKRKYHSREVLIHSFHGCKRAPPSITLARHRREDDGRSGHGHHRLKFYVHWNFCWFIGDEVNLFPGFGTEADSLWPLFQFM